MECSWFLTASMNRQFSVYLMISENSSITADAVLFISTVEFVICTVHLTMCHAVTRVVFQSGHVIARWVMNKGKRDPKFTLVRPLSRVTNMAPRGSWRVRSGRQTVNWSLWRLVRFSRLVIIVLEAPSTLEKPRRLCCDAFYCIL